jgi:hypothetical protein
VGPRGGVDDVEKRKFFNLLGLELRPLGRPARSQSLYRLRYPSFLVLQKATEIYRIKEMAFLEFILR